MGDYRDFRTILAIAAILAAIVLVSRFLTTPQVDATCAFVQLTGDPNPEHCSRLYRWFGI